MEKHSLQKCIFQVLQMKATISLKAPCSAPCDFIEKKKTSPQMKPSSSPKGQSVWKLHTWL